jgi:hypothetical protein
VSSMCVTYECHPERSEGSGCLARATRVALARPRFLALLGMTIRERRMTNEKGFRPLTKTGNP